MSRSFWIYLAALAALLVLAWLRWTGVLASADEGEKDDVVILRLEQKDIEKISFHAEKLDAVLDLREDAMGRYAWVTLEERKEKAKPAAPVQAAPEPAAEAAAEPAPDAAAEAASPEATAEPAAEPAAEAAAAAPAEAPAEVETARSEFKGGDAVDKLLEGLAPLKAVRALGEVPADKLAELELETPASWVEITYKGKVRRLELGGEAYGTRDTYLRDTENGAYYLVDAELFRPLKYAKSRLPDRRLTALEPADVKSAVLEIPGGRVEMLHQNRQDEEAAYWASAASPERNVELYANWLDKALRLKGLNYVQADEQPAALVPAFKLTLAPEEGPATAIELLEEKDPAGGESTWYARSEFTRGLQKVHKTLASEAADDVRDVVDARPEDEPEEAAEEPAEEPVGEPVGEPVVP